MHPIQRTRLLRKNGRGLKVCCLSSSRTSSEPSKRRMLRKRAAQEAFILVERNYEATPSSTRLCEPLHDRQSSLRRVNERSFVLGHLLVALKTTGSEFPKPANHEIPVVVLGVLPNGGLLAIATCRFGASTSSSKRRGDTGVARGGCLRP